MIYKNSIQLPIKNFKISSVALICCVVISLGISEPSHECPLPLIVYKIVSALQFFQRSPYTAQLTVNVVGVGEHPFWFAQKLAYLGMLGNLARPLQGAILSLVPLNAITAMGWEGFTIS